MKLHLHLAWLALLLCSATAIAQAPERLVTIDRAAGEVRVMCEMLGVEAPLEFVCVVRGTADHEAMVRTTATPSTIHTGLLALGMEPGRPLTWNAASETYSPPSGPPLTVSLEWDDDGEVRRERIGALLRHIETGNPRPPQPFVFVGSTMYDTAEGERYAADATGQVVSLVNFESPVVDVPALASNSNALLQWELNLDRVPPPGTPVTLVLSPIAGDAKPSPTTQPTRSISPSA